MNGWGIEIAGSWYAQLSTAEPLHFYSPSGADKKALLSSVAA
jgi:hypothetical protein